MTGGPISIPPDERAARPPGHAEASQNRAAFVVTALLVLFAGAVLSVDRPRLDKTTQALRPQHGEAEQALDEVTACLGIPQDPIWVIASGSDEREVWQHLTQAEALLGQARSNHVISSYLLPAALWPRVEFQESNRATARWLGSAGPCAARGSAARGLQQQCPVPDRRTGPHLGARRRQHGSRLADEPTEPMAAETVHGAHRPTSGW